MRYGGVAYLNARPLLEGLEPLVRAEPAALVRCFERGEVDVALLPVAAAEAAGLTRVGSLGIASAGPVESVLLFLRKPLDEVRTVSLDPASRTSRVLTLLLLEGAREVSGDADAELVIGDRALIRARGESRVVDLALLWRERTGLPFVFAAWYGDPRAESALEAAWARGRLRIAEYAAEAASGIGVAAAELERYLRESLRHRLGPDEERGLSLFLRRARAAGLL